MTATMYEKISKAPIEEVLCLATLIACVELSPSATLKDSDRYFERIVTCDQCPYEYKCLAVIINE